MPASSGRTPVPLSAALQPGKKYIFEVSGLVSYWGDHPETEVDPGYCFAKWRCPTPEFWGAFSMNNDDLKNWSSSTVNYSDSHTYSFCIDTSQTMFKPSFTAQGLTGSFNVTVYEAQGSGSPITVSSATYGAVCRVAAGNDTANVAGKCNGKSTCSYVVSNNTRPGGDPAPGCAKDFKVQYSCGSGGQKEASHPASVDEGYSVTLSCN